MSQECAVCRQPAVVTAHIYRGDQKATVCLCESCVHKVGKKMQVVIVGSTIQSLPKGTIITPPSQIQTPRPQRSPQQSPPHETSPQTSQVSLDNHNCVNCYRCGTIIPIHSKFCPECGATIKHAETSVFQRASNDNPISVKCYRCGASIPVYAKFCPVCGESRIATQNKDTQNSHGVPATDDEYRSIISNVEPAAEQNNMEISRPLNSYHDSANNTPSNTKMKNGWKVACISLLMTLILIPILLFLHKQGIIFNDKNSIPVPATENTPTYTPPKSELTSPKTSVNDSNHYLCAGGFHTVGIKEDGTLVATGSNSFHQCNTSGWMDIVSVTAGSFHTVGLTEDGTVVAVGSNEEGESNVSNWRDIVKVVAGTYITVGIKSDGTVLAAGNNDYGQCEVSTWKNIIDVAADWFHVVGLKSDGTVIAAGDNRSGECDVSRWSDIIAIAAGEGYTLGLKSDGTVLATGRNSFGQCDVSDWTDIIAISALYRYSVGLKKDGTVVATGDNEYGQCNVTSWKNIVAISAGNYHTVGLKADGSVISTKINTFDSDFNCGQTEVSSWKLKINKNR